MTIRPKNTLYLWICIHILLPAWGAAAQGTADDFKNRGNLYYNHGQMEKAASEYSKAISLKPSFTEAYFNRGLANFKLGFYYKAIVNFDKAISLSPNTGDAYYSRGLAYEKAGRITLAIEEFKRARQLGDEDAEAYLNQNHIRQEEIYHTASFNASYGRNKTIIWYDESLNMQKKDLYYTGKMLDIIGSHYYDKSGRLTKKILQDKHGRVIKKN